MKDDFQNYDKPFFAVYATVIFAILCAVCAGCWIALFVLSYFLG